MGYTYLRYIRAQALKVRRTGRRSGDRLRLINSGEQNIEPVYPDTMAFQWNMSYC
jgi:hypothetical protein